MLRWCLVMAAAMAAQSVTAQDRPDAVPAPAGAPPSADSLRTPMSVIDTLATARVDTLKRIPPLRFSGALSTPAHPLRAITAEHILWNDYRSLADLLTATPGVLVRETASPGQADEVSITGAGHEGTALLVDGVPHNDPVTGTYNFASFPVEAIDRVEFVTGPRAFIYGENAVGGAVNVVTKSFVNNTPYTRIRYSQSSFSYTQTDVMFSQNILPRFNLSFGMSFLGFGSDKTSNRNRGRFINADHQGYTFRTKLRYNVSGTMNLVATHMYSQAKTGRNGGIDLGATDPVKVYDEGAAAVVNPDAYEKRSGHHAAVSALYQPAGDSSLHASVSLYGSQQLGEYRDEENRPFPNGFTFAEDHASAAVGARGQVDWEHAWNLFTAIGNLSHTEFDRSVYGASFSQTARTLSLKDEMTVAGFMTFAVFVKLVNGDFGAADNAGADLTLRLPCSLALTAGASRAHRHLTLPERYLQGDAADSTIQKILGSPAFVPATSPAFVRTDEVHTIAEAGVAFTPSEAFEARITGTRRVIDNWADRTLIKVSQQQTLTVDAVTASFATQHGDFHLDAQAAYTRHSDVLRNDAPLRLYPEWRGQASLYFRGPLAEGNLDLKAGVKGMFVSAFDGDQRRVVDGVPNPIVNREIGKAGTLDLFVIAHIGNAYIHVLMDNLTGSQYMLTPFHPMYGRTLRFGVSWEFFD